MSKCNYIPNGDSIYILGETADVPVIECKKTTNSIGENNYLCQGDIQNNLWKFSPGKNNQNCRWYNCRYPFTIQNNGENNVNIDTNDYGGCIETNFPYVIEKNNNDCMVHNVFTGEQLEDSCNTGLQCCTAGKQCDATDCMAYKAIDSYLVDGIRKYRCDNGRCIETEPGKGEYTNPYCDYECLNRAYPKIYDCVDGVCLNVGRDKGVYDNPLCDAQCVLQKNLKYKCDNGECKVYTPDDKETDKKSNGTGQTKIYDTFKDCYKECSDAGYIVPPEQKYKDKKKKEQKLMILYILGIIITLLLFGIILRL